MKGQEKVLYADDHNNGLYTTTVKGTIIRWEICKEPDYCKKWGYLIGLKSFVIS